MVDRVTSRIFSGGPSKTAGSAFPCSAILGPSVFRIFVKSTRQSTLRKFAPERAAAGRKSTESFGEKNPGGDTPRDTETSFTGGGARSVYTLQINYRWTS